MLGKFNTTVPGGRPVAADERLRTTVHPSRVEYMSPPATLRKVCGVSPVGLFEQPVCCYSNTARALPVEGA